jgi:hypothetical protein
MAETTIDHCQHTNYHAVPLLSWGCALPRGARSHLRVQSSRQSGYLEKEMLGSEIFTNKKIKKN